MRGLFWALTVFSLAVAVSIVLRANDGYVLFVLPPYRVEMSLALLAVILVGGFVVCLLATWLPFVTDTPTRGTLVSVDDVVTGEGHVG